MLITVLTVVLVAFVSNAGGKRPLMDTRESRADEYKELFDLTEDKDGLESIRAIHEHLDNDNDKAFCEMGDFIWVD